MSAGNIITARLIAGAPGVPSGELWQYDYGQIIRFTGVELPESYEVHFANARGGESKTQIGTADGCAIPDEFLLSGAPLFIWIFLHAGEADGETEYAVTVPVLHRAKPTDEEPTPEQQSAITEAIAALNSGVTRAESAAAQAEAASAAVQDLDVEATTLSPGAPATVEKSVDPDTGAVSLTFGIPKGKTGNKGDTGATPDLRIGAVSTLPAGSPATAEISGTPENPLLDLGIPKGDPGEVTEAELDAALAQKAGILRDTASGSIVSIVPDASVENLLGLSVSVEPVQTGSGDPSPDNVRPISGWDAVNVTRAGKNLLPTWVPISNSNGLTSEVNDDGSVRIHGTATGTGGYISDTIVFPTEITFDGGTMGFGVALPNRIRTFKRDANGVTLGSFDVNAGESSYTFTPQYNMSGAKRCQFYFNTVAGTEYDFVIYPQLELGSATAYEPYQGNQYTIQLGQDTYLGTLKAVEGTFLVDRAIFDLTDVRGWNKSTSYPGGFYRACGNFAPAIKVATPFVCSHAKTARNLVEYLPGTCVSDGSVNIRIMPETATVSDWESYLSAQGEAGTPVQICCYIATPFEIPLTPTQIAALQGTNTVWSDAGDVTVEYAADLKTYIDQKIAAAVAAMAGD